MTNDKIPMTNESPNDKSLNYLKFYDSFGFWNLDFGFSNKAFTTIELIMVIAIVGILAAVVMPAFLASYDTLKLEGAYRQLMQDMRYCQQLAIARQTTHGISFSPSTETYFVYRQTTSNIVKDPATQKPLSVTYSGGKFSGIDFVSTTFLLPVPDRLEFNSLGAPSSGGTVTLSYSGISKAIQVEPNTGRIQ